jgi:Kef-type K+ transport system membrane component KefB
MALSFVLQELVGATSVQAFAAGAALCSTSLGTTFTVLASSGLSSSRLGVVLTSAAMMDDVVGLVMVQVISNLGGNFSAVTVVRPIAVSVGFAIFVPLACSFFLKPATLFLNRFREAHPNTATCRVFGFRHTAFAIHTALLLALVAGSSYAGTSNLFAAYIAGATISWWDSEVPHLISQATTDQAHPAEEKSSRTDPTPGENSPSEQSTATRPETIFHAKIEGGAVAPDATRSLDNSTMSSSQEHETSGRAVYERYYHHPVSKILQPFFFASIGFSIPITRMFSGEIVWKGIVYAIIMTFGKLVCGLWLVRFHLVPIKNGIRGALSKVKMPSTPHVWGKKSTPESTSQMSQCEGRATELQPPGASATAVLSSQNDTLSPPHPFSLQPPLILALAMTARGEIGFLISAIAESGGVFKSAFDSGSESDIFLVVTWAIVLCTIIGPLGVGFCVRRVRALEEMKERLHEGSGRDVLGVWGVGK